MKTKRNKIIPFDKYFTREEIKLIRLILESALEEDIGSGDITTQATVNPQKKAIGYLRIKENGIIAGLPLIEMILKLKTGHYRIKYNAREGDIIQKGRILAEITAPAWILLILERTLLNFLQRLSGIATLTRKYLDSAGNYPVKIMDTRKTTPLLRLLEKYAVMVGGGTNHRFGLYDEILIKDNHIRLSGGIENAVKNIRRKYPGIPIEVEAKSLDEVRRIIPYRPEIILLDNMTVRQLKSAVKLVHGKAELEASGGINLKNIKKIASTGIDRISIGALTHSAPALDISLKIHPVKN